MTIKEARKKAGLTQKQMSELLEIPRRTIEDWERNIYAPPKYTERLIIQELLRIAYKNEMGIVDEGNIVPDKDLE